MAFFRCLEDLVLLFDEACPWNLLGSVKAKRGSSHLFFSRESRPAFQSGLPHLVPQQDQEVTSPP